MITPHIPPIPYLRDTLPPEFADEQRRTWTFDVSPSAVFFGTLLAAVILVGGCAALAVWLP